MSKVADSIRRGLNEALVYAVAVQLRYQKRCRNLPSLVSSPISGADGRGLAGTPPSNS